MKTRTNSPWWLAGLTSVLLLLTTFGMLGIALVFGCVGRAKGAEVGPLRWQCVPEASIALTQGDDVVWQFNYALGQNQAYFHPVALPGGPTLTADQPADHLWHHALWFSWKYINGVNYWEHDRETGKPAGRTLWSNVTIDTRDDFSARIAMDLAFVDPAGAKVMTGKRTVDISPPLASGRYHVDWTCSFTAGVKDVTLDRTPLPGEPDGKAWGGYAGLSVRLANEMTDRSAATVAGPVSLESGRYRGKAEALDYHGVIGGRAVGIAICDHPANLNHPTPWYVIADKPMSYFSPAVICYQPHTLPAGQSMTLRYRVIVHPDRWNAEQLRREQRQYIEDNAAGQQ